MPRRSGSGRVSRARRLSKIGVRVFARHGRAAGDDATLEGGLCRDFRAGPDDLRLLTEVSARFPKKHFAAILGPSGCGKSTLLKTIAGLREPTKGQIEWDGIDLAEQDMAPHEIGYVPQFSIAHELLTVDECVSGALRLRVAGIHGEELDERITRVLKGVGLDEIADRRVSLLSGGQKRRLAMAMEMVSSPHLLLCDEVTSGLDPKSEDEIVP